MSLSIPSANITNGLYKIFSVQYPTQDADLLSPGGANGTIGGYQTNTQSTRMVWNVTNVLDVSAGHITLVNQAITTYAQVSQESASSLNLTLVGNPTNPLVWSATPASTNGTYYLTLTGDVPLVWTLPSDVDGTPINVQPKASPQQDNQLWKFVPAT